MSHASVTAAAQFLATHGRILDRRRFDRLFEDGDAAPVRDAVAAYRNRDGGFGHALEPDGRTPGSQPAAVELGLRALHQADAWDDDLAAGACDWLERTAPAGGGTPFVTPSVEGWPRAPWWQVQDGLPASPVTTGQIAGTLHARKVDHPWLDRATDWMWSQIEGPAHTDPGDDHLGAYEMRGVLGFLQHVPDRPRAERAFDPVGRLLVRSGLLTLDPDADADGEVHGPLDFAPLPDSLARAVVDPSVVEAHLDRLVAGQRDDGGWTFNWTAWSPLAESEWRGSVTVDALYVLRANGRLQ